MKNRLFTLFSFFFFGLASLAVSGQQTLENDFPWREADESEFTQRPVERRIIPQKYRTYALDFRTMKKILENAPLRFSEAASHQRVTISLPLPDGSRQRFRIVEAPVMDELLIEKYADIRAFAGTGVDDPTLSVRLGWSAKGFHAMILSGNGESYFIDTYGESDTEHYISYDRKDFKRKHEPQFHCETEDIADQLIEDIPLENTARRPGDCMLRTYRLALACTGEYATYHGGTKAGVLAEMNRSIARVNGIYERDFGVTLRLVPKNDTLIFLNPSTDPYTNTNVSTMMGQNQTTCDRYIGNANYDIGHVFGTGDGGIANLRAVCEMNVKARGVTGLPDPVGDPFYLDYVCHEMGHQFGANHTQNNACGRVLSAAMEPGSGSTIMSYAGLCAPNVQNQVDAYFHAYSIFEVSSFIINGAGNTCGQVTATGNNAPGAIAGLDKTIPVQTPFILTGLAGDPDGINSLLFSWEQIDPEVATMPPLANSTQGPSFRSYPPSTSTSRIFPNFFNLLNNLPNTWEVLPSVNRNLKFRFSVRDNHLGAGCVAEDDLSLVVTNTAGPFVVNNPNGGEAWVVGNSATITWNVANTTAAPVSCSLVDIFLSTDGGLSFPVVLAGGVPNNGSFTFVVPNNLTTEARVIVKCSDNYFFDVSNQHFTIKEPDVPTFTFAVDNNEKSVCADEEITFDLTLSALVGFNEIVNLSVSGVPGGAVATFTPSSVTPTGQSTLRIHQLSNVPTGAYPLTVRGLSLTKDLTINLTLNVFNGLPDKVALTTPADGALNIPNQTTLTWADDVKAENYFVEIATSPAFGSNTVASGDTPDNTVNLVNLTNNTIYYWRVTAQNPCGDGAISEIFAFRTANPSCATFTSTNVPIVIPDASPGVHTSTLIINENFNILDANVFVQIDHTWLGDIQASITAPDGTVLNLFDRPGFPTSQFGCGESNIRVTFNDEATRNSNDLESTCVAGALFGIDGEFRPIQSLSALDGKSANGTWTLTVRDNAAEDGGAIIAWNVVLCRAVVPPVAPGILTNLALSVLEGETKTVPRSLLEATSAGNAPTQIIFQLRKAPARGNLLLDGVVQNAGDTFTQDDINKNKISYQHTGDNTFTQDHFIFDVFNSGGGWLSGRTFNINILTNTLAVTALVTKEISCFNAGDAQITVSAAGGIAPYQYQLDNSSFQASNVFNNVVAGAHTITIRDANNFTRTSGTINIANPAQIIVSANVSNDDITVNASGGSGNLLFSINGVDFQTSNQFNDLPNGSYTITAKDENECTATTTVIVAVNTLVVSAAQRDAITCHNDTDGSIEIMAGGGNPPYQYSLDGGTYQLSNIFSGLGAGTYTVTVKDANDIVGTTNAVTLANPSAIIVSPSVNGNTVTINASGGTGTLRYSLNATDFQASNVFGNLANGAYTVTVQDANGCTETADFDILTNTLSVSVLITNYITCHGSDNGAIRVNVSGGRAPFEYSLNGGTYQSSALFSGLDGGDYTVTVRDADGFLKETSIVTLEEPAALTANSQVMGYAVTILAQGGTPPYQYSLNNGQSFQSGNEFDPVPSGDYNALVKDFNDCIFSLSVTVNVAPLTLDAEVTQGIRCFGQNNGLVTLSAAGGVAPYEYSLDGQTFQSSPIFSNLYSGSYTFTVRDAGGITITADVILIEANPLQVSLGVSNASIIVSAWGGAGGFQYSLNGGIFQLDSIFAGIQSGRTYNIDVLDANGCITSTSIQIPRVTISAQFVQVSCTGQQDGQITVAASGGFQPYQYSLDGINYQLSEIFTNLPVGGHTVYVKDAGGFVYTYNFVINEPPPIQLSVIVMGDTAILIGLGGTPPYQYSINGTDFQMLNQFVALPDGNYTGTIRDARGCTSTVPVMITFVRNVDFDLSFELFPNPSAGEAILQLNQPTDEMIRIQIFDVAGRLVFDEKTEKSGAFLKQKLNLSALQSGHYQVIVSDGKVFGRKQLVVIR